MEASGLLDRPVKNFGQIMAKTAANAGFCHKIMAFFAVSYHLHAAFLPQKSRFHFCRQGHVRAGIGTLDLRHRAAGAQVRRPTLAAGAAAQQAAFFVMSAAVVIAIKEAAFGSGGGFHAVYYTLC